MSILDRLQRHFADDDDDELRETNVCTSCGRAFDTESNLCPDCGSEQIVTSTHR
ncbi:hypothetical protein [Haladaptatus sp. NG-WS-4]